VAHTPRVERPALALDLLPDIYPRRPVKQEPARPERIASQKASIRDEVCLKLPIVLDKDQRVTGMLDRA